MVLARVWMALVPMAAIGAAAEAGAAEQWSLVLADAMGEGRDLELYVVWDGGKVARAFGRGPRFNRMPYAVAACDVRLAEGRLRGRFDVGIPWDGYVPRDGKTLVVSATFDAAATSEGFDGTYKVQADRESRSGTLAGVRSRPPDAGQVRRLTLHCEDTVQKARKIGSSRRIGMVLSFKAGRCFAARLVPFGSITDVGMTATVAKHELTFDGQRLGGTLVGLVRRQGDLEAPVRHEFAFDGWVIGGEAGGTIKVTEDGKPRTDGAFTGEATVGAADPADATCTMTLHEAIPTHNFLNVLFTIRGGEVLGGFAVSPNFNNSIHTVDFSGLRLGGGRLGGTLGVTIVPDPWIPKDHKPVTCRYAIDAAIADGELSGGFTGRFGPAEVKGGVEGSFDRKPSLKDVAAITLKVENGVFGRTFLTMQYAGGKLASSRVWNNHDRSMTGTVDKADLDWSDERFRGTLEVTVRRAGSPAAGGTCKVDGVLIGTMGAGTAETTVADGRRKTSTFWVSLQPAGK